MSGSVENQLGSGGHPAVLLSGDADMTVAQALNEAIEAAASDHDIVIVDLSRATLIDSRTIGVLANWAGKLRARDGDLPIVGAGSDILRLLRTIGLESSFSFHPDQDSVTSPGRRSSI